MKRLQHYFVRWIGARAALPGIQEPCEMAFEAKAAGLSKLNGPDAIV